MTLALDALLALLLLAVAGFTVWAPGTRAAVIGFITLGLLLALAWVRLAGVDVALTEATVGGGATGILLLRAWARLGPSPVPVSGRGLRLAASALAGLVTLALALFVLALPPEGPSLAAPAIAGIDTFGLGNPVTAVLLGYRALDTLLEKIVLLLAVIGVWALARDADWGGPPLPLAGLANGDERDTSLALMARALPPIGIVFGLYLVWIGADHPGGTFQGGAVLAAMWLLAMLAGVAAAPRTGSPRLRLALVAGPALFIAVGFAGVPLAGAFLTYPPDLAKAIIVAVEFALTLAVAVVVVLLVAGPAGQVRR
ncbi:MnhB domain-containing protein [Ancylobacter pratisalsi]|uniref:DUF4040 domain-containing protein n=1 Tax=Ancylobacter pratisalsi TaxID=1745854 RepID=A0A6P1YJZ5_9HYPH|nr:MnhB domain-containing protein [Ancylobacter pratisalsi]QIB33648.1 DUF4040 domain-containing protein [Ancylobacter pratisalsi]